MVRKLFRIGREDLRRAFEVAGFLFAHADVEQHVGIARVLLQDLLQQLERPRVVVHEGVHRGAQSLEFEIGRFAPAGGFAPGDGLGVAALPELLLQRRNVWLHGFGKVFTWKGLEEWRYPASRSQRKSTR